MRAGVRHEDPTKKEHAPSENPKSPFGRACLKERRRVASTSTQLRHVFLGRLDDLSTAIVPTVLARPVHHLRVAAVIALHELRGLQLVVVGRSAFSSARFRMSSFRYSHSLVPNA